jgi:hypothetical protein
VPICAFPSVPFTTFISLSSGDQSYQIIILLPSCNTFCLYSLQSADFKCYKTEFTRAFTSETDFPRLATNPSAQWVRGHSWNPWSWSCCYLGAPGSIALLTSPSRPRNRNGKITIPSERQMQPGGSVTSGFWDCSVGSPVQIQLSSKIDCSVDCFANSHSSLNAGIGL